MLSLLEGLLRGILGVSSNICAPNYIPPRSTQNIDLGSPKSMNAHGRFKARIQSENIEIPSVGQLCCCQVLYFDGLQHFAFTLKHCINSPLGAALHALQIRMGV